ncbi:MAG TPA: hypothetical protein VK791_01105 [bacterium]|nr:hypothetical protein [bacterium]
MESDVTRYQFQQNEDLNTAFEKLIASISNEFPAAAHHKEKIELILRAQLLPHLFVNRECSHREVCLHSFNMKLANSFSKIPQINGLKTGSSI